MDLRRERRTASRAMGILVLLIVMVLCGIVVLLVAGRESGSVPAAVIPSDIEGMDERVESAGSPILFPNKKNDPETFSYEINAKPVFESWDAEGDLKIENPSRNLYLMAVELVQDDGQVVFRSGYIRPGQKLEQAALDVRLAPGDHPLTALICAVDPQTLELLGILEQPVTVRIEK